MAGMSVLPTAAASASETPETPPNTMLDTIVTCARLARTGPTSALAKSIRRSSMPQRPMRSPAMMKNGIASSGNESIAPNMMVGTTLRLACPDTTM